jgi:cyclopropane fatty-acyl-phospholipid synthase-like methyltransferase
LNFIVNTRDISIFHQQIDEEILDMLKLPARKPNFFQATSRKLEIFFEKANGLDFSEVILSKNLGYDDSIVHKCSPSGNKFLSRLLQDLTITHRCRILDIGCGKGSAIRCMTKFPFQRIDGVEISEKIANIAKTNFEKLGIPNVKIFNTSAIEFDS